MVTSGQFGRAAAYGGSGLLGLGAAAAGVIAVQGTQAKRTIGVRSMAAPYADRRYGRSKGPSLRLVVLGDSLAAGLGADRPDDTIGAMLASFVSEYTGQAVVLTTVATVGDRSRDLDAQVTRALHYRPHVAVIIIGANDVTHMVPPRISGRLLGDGVRRLRGAGVQVVVGTCPDLGTVQPFQQPLRALARRNSRHLAAVQTVAAVSAGGRAVSLGDLFGQEFSARPRDLFSHDRFHPNTAGYHAVAQALASSVIAALTRGEQGEVLPILLTTPVLAPLEDSALLAVDRPGTEVTPAPAPTSTDSRLWGRWARSLRRGPPSPGSGSRPRSAPEPIDTGGTV